MKSKRHEYKQQAISLRIAGSSMREIEKALRIPRSTLSGWFRGIRLTEIQKTRLKNNWSKALIKARKKAAIWHNKQKENRLNLARAQAETVLVQTNFKSLPDLELALAMLYLGEGAKANSTSMGNSNPMILKFFIQCLYMLYDIEPFTLKCELHLRSDQNAQGLMSFWSKELSIPLNNFNYCKDKRTVKVKTRVGYKGVCVVRCGRVDILRRLNFISQGFCEKILNTRTRSSVG